MFDPKCHEVAAYFLDGEEEVTVDEVNKLAQHIQDEIESWLGSRDPTLIAKLAARYMTITLHLGDCLGVMATLPGGGVDLVVADLPYGTTYAAWDKEIPMHQLWPALLRVGTWQRCDDLYRVAAVHVGADIQRARVVFVLSGYGIRSTEPISPMPTSSRSKSMRASSCLRADRRNITRSKCPER